MLLLPFLLPIAELLYVAPLLHENNPVGIVLLATITSLVYPSHSQIPS